MQLWVALPDSQRNWQPSFTSVKKVPVIQIPGGIIQLFAGTLGGVTSPAPYFSDFIGLDVQVHTDKTIEFELNPEFEHATLVLSGDCRFENQPLQDRTLYYLGSRRASIGFSSPAGGGCW